MEDQRAERGFYSQPALGNPLLLGGALEAPRGGRSLQTPGPAGGVCLHQALWFPPALGTVCCLCPWWCMCVGCPTRLARDPVTLQPQHEYLTEENEEGEVGQGPLEHIPLNKCIKSGSHLSPQMGSLWSLFPPSAGSPARRGQGH